MKITEGVEPISHLQFADDTFLAGEALTREARIIKVIIDQYAHVLGQRVNWTKSEIFFFNTEPSIHWDISRIIGMKLGKLPNKFIDIPLFGGENKSTPWKNLVESCFSRLEG